MVDVGSARSVYVGDDAMKMRGVLKVSYPIQRGDIMDWDAYFEILNHIFYNLLRIENLSNYPIIYAEHPFVPKETKQYIARLLYETHGVRSLIMMESPLLSNFSVGLITGLVIESGDGVTWIAPVINGQVQHQAVQKLLLSGIDVNHNLQNLLMRDGINIQSSSAEEIIKEIKEKNCYFVLDPASPPASASSDILTYPMPDGTIKQIPNRILYEAPEVMFQPTMLGYNVMNIPQAIIYSLQLISNEYWAELLGHIVLSGGNASYSGFEERLKQELNALLPQLGPIPEPKKISPSFSSPAMKLESVQGARKTEDNCPNCGALVDLSDEQNQCPFCGTDMTTSQMALDLGTSSKMNITSFTGVCPSCNKEVKDKTSVFCPYCGQSLESLNITEVPKESPELTPMAGEFVEIDDSSEIIRFFVPDNLQFAIFNGAAILGSLPSFQNLFISYEQFQTNSDIIFRDISEVFR
jgi:actin-related protein